MHDDARCPRHPGNPVVAVCARCGTFLCSDDVQPLDGQTYCPECVARPDVDYLEAYRLKYWGKRDGWAWVVGSGGLLSLLVAAFFVSLFFRGAVATEAAGGLMVGVVTGLTGAVVGFAFFAGVPWARPAFLAMPLLSAFLNGAVNGPSAAVTALLPFLFALAIFVDTRNRLFFKVAVPREKLKKSWDLYANNTLARFGLSFSVVGLVLPPVALLGLGLSIVGLTRVDPKAHPPIGKKAHAIAGIVLGIAGLAWGVYLARLLGTAFND